MGIGLWFINEIPTAHTSTTRPGQCEYAVLNHHLASSYKVSPWKLQHQPHTTRVSRLAEGSRTLWYSPCVDRTLVTGHTNLTVRDVSLAQSLDVWNANAFHLQELKFFQSF